MNKLKIGRDCYYSHMDGALVASVAPHIGWDYKREFIHVDSISTSGHKFTGIPFPCGIFVSLNRNNLNQISKEVQYIGSHDLTIMGSRNGHSVLFLLDIITQKGIEGFQKSAMECRKNAEYLFDKLKNDFPQDMEPILNQHSITVVFNSPSQELIDKWQV